MGFLFAVSFFLFLKSSYLFVVQIDIIFRLFAILQKYEFSSKSQHLLQSRLNNVGCLRYCKSTSFQANHNKLLDCHCSLFVVCDTAKVRVFKQITTGWCTFRPQLGCLRYCKSTSFQANHNTLHNCVLLKSVVCDTAKVRVFKQITTILALYWRIERLFAILQKYEFSSKSQRRRYSL